MEALTSSTFSWCHVVPAAWTVYPHLMSQTWCDSSSDLAQTLGFPVELTPQVALLSATSEVLLVNCQVR